MVRAFAYRPRAISPNSENPSRSAASLPRQNASPGRSPMQPQTRLLVLTLLSGVLPFSQTGCVTPQARLQAEEESERVKDLDVLTIRQVSEVANILPVQLQGVGLVTGLDGTGGGAPPNEYRKMLERE